MKYDRFDLETEIQNVWQTKDDLDAITERLYDDPDGQMTEDEISNVLIGLSELHETRMKKLWRVFDTMVRENCFVATLHDEIPPKEALFQKNLNINSGYGPQTHNPSEEESFFRGNTSPLK
jgi:hypothetical protein